MTTTLITGANKGLGYEAARRLLADGHDVWVAARDGERGRRAAAELGARFVQLDVTDAASITAAAAAVKAETDLNNSSGHQTVHEGTDAIVAMASIGPDGPTGTFTDRHGVVPW